MDAALLSAQTAYLEQLSVAMITNAAFDACGSQLAALVDERGANCTACA